MYDLNLLRVLFSRNFFGNLLHSTAAAKEKALSPNVLLQHGVLSVKFCKLCGAPLEASGVPVGWE